MKMPRTELVAMFDENRNRSDPWDRRTSQYTVADIDGDGLLQAAVREAVINAFCHRSYASGLAVQVDIFPDKVEVFSPGHFPSDTTPEERVRAERPYSKSPNKLIAETLYRSRDIESYGTGIPRIRDLCASAGVSFEYLVMAQGTVLRFHRPDWARSEAATNGPENNGLSTALPAHGEEVIEYLRAHGKSGSAEMSKEIGVSESQTRRILSKIVESGAIVRIGRSVSAQYDLPGQAKH